MSFRRLLARIKSVTDRLGFPVRASHADKLDTCARAVSHYANRGPAFEPGVALDSPSNYPAQARIIAFFLPQFYRFPENDAWWGPGFTEWRNVARGMPRYQGHYQPRIPADLGCYDLTDVSVLEAQAKLAASAGIEAFCFYYYWFNGKRLMEKPLDLFADAEMPVDFCLMWANENWTRAWDGLENEVLIRQDYRQEDEAAFIADTARYMANEKYLKVADRPVFIVYRASLLPEPKETLSRWRELWSEKLGVCPWLLMAQSFEEIDPVQYGLDGAVEFPPHKICKGLGNLRSSVRLLDKDFNGLVRDYSAVVDQSLSLPVPEFTEIKTVSPSWDNDARREARGTSWYGATPVQYERWLSGTIEHAKNHRFQGDALVFINAWNEWAEGAYLEPDIYFGHAMLNATRRAVLGMRSIPSQAPILLVGHDAHRHGAQLLLLNLAKALVNSLHCTVHIVLLEGGDLVREYQRYARTTILGETTLADHLELLGTSLCDYRAAIINTTVSGSQLPEIKVAEVPSISLIHELPALIKAYSLEPQVKHVADLSDHVVFAAQMVKTGFDSFGHSIQGKCHIRPQGSYQSAERHPTARERLRYSLGLRKEHKLIINVGYADGRKGFDLFLQTAKQAAQDYPNWHFLWVGKLHSDMKALVNEELKNLRLQTRLHLPGYIANNTDHFSAADALLLTSREDPYPTVILEGLEAGLPFVAYQGCTGVDDLAKQFGRVVPIGDSAATLDALAELISSDNEDLRCERKNYVHHHCQMAHYCEALLGFLES